MAAREGKESILCYEGLSVFRVFAEDTRSVQMEGIYRN